MSIIFYNLEYIYQLYLTLLSMFYDLLMMLWRNKNRGIPAAYKLSGGP